MPSPAIPSHVPIAASYRGPHPENIHHGSLAVVDRTGRLLAAVGDVETPVFPRSAIKPFQAMPLIASAAERLELTDADIALLCASHNGEPVHVQTVTQLLARIGADESRLACGTHTPYFYAATGRTPAPDARFSRLQHNCSGKHAGMLLLADSLGEPLTHYLHEDHPAQQAIADSIAHWTGIPRTELGWGIDGCSAPSCALPLRALAWAYARLTDPQDDPVYGRAHQRIARAMSRHPALVSGQGRNDLILMQAGAGDWVSKVGADGVQALASFERGIGIAAKCSDGQLLPLMVALVAALEQLDWLDEARRQALQSLLPAPLTNAAGIEVGTWRPLIDLKPGSGS